MFISFLNLIDDNDEQWKFERVYYQYRNLMYHVAYSILKNRQDAEDAVQIAFIRIANHIKQIDDKNCNKTKAFVVVIVERIAINLYNKQKNESHKSYDDISYNIASNEILEDVVIDNILVGDILKKISELPVKYCEVLKLKYVYGLSGKEIAKIVDISHAAVRKRIERGLKMLQLEIKGN